MGIMCIYIYSLIYVIDFLILDWQILPNYTQIYFCLLTGKFNRYVFDRRIQSLEGKIMCVFFFEYISTNDEISVKLQVEKTFLRLFI